jgi:hypothetical protein
MNIAFSLTTSQVRSQTKTVTRRLGWLKLQPGKKLYAVEKSQGLKKGEHVNYLALIEVVSVRREPLHRITQADVIAEGFPDLTPAEFIPFFCQGHRGCTPETEVTRIEFRYLHSL